MDKEEEHKIAEKEKEDKHSGVIDIEDAISNQIHEENMINKALDKKT